MTVATNAEGRRAQQVEIPLSLGPRKEGKDKEGQPCLVWDFVVAPATLDAAHASPGMLRTVVETVSAAGCYPWGSAASMPSHACRRCLQRQLCSVQQHEPHKWVGAMHVHDREGSWCGARRAGLLQLQGQGCGCLPWVLACECFLCCGAEACAGPWGPEQGLHGLRCLLTLPCS